MTEHIVTIKQGKIKGTSDTDLDGGKFYKFLGIPYAKPPIGSLRFKAPQPPDSWNEVRDCTEEGNACLSANRVSPDELVGSEDCLYLNVFTKQYSQSGSSPKPVMVFIHGGAFTLGSGSQDLYGAKHLLTQDIVLVTINYRLGILGFLSSDDLSLEVSGNAGLKDQTFALRWVQENIASFNGDTNNVTIFGVSAGGVSVQFQVISPLAKGLFHKAIAQSGSTLNPWAWGSKNAIQVAKELGKTAATDKEALKVLLNASAEELVKASLKLSDQVMNANKRRPFGPVIEKPNPTAFITENPVNLLASGKYNQVPMIQGITSNEGLVYEYFHMGEPFEIGLDNVVPWNLNLEHNSDLYADVSKLINEFYFKNGFNKEAIYKFTGDVNFVHGVVESTKLICKTSANPVYLYVFSQEVSLSNIMRTIFGITDDTIRGVAHGGDQMVLFSTNLMDLLGVEMTDESKAAVKQFVKLWTDFARTGIPHQHWEPVTDPDNLKYFQIDNNILLKTNPFAERVTFWENISRDSPSIYESSLTKGKL